MVSEADFATIVERYSDVTERLKRSHELLTREVCNLREELQEKNKELAQRERLAALGEMAAGVAHEIRNPLGAIGLYASLLERDLGDHPQQLGIARRIGVGVRSLESIVGDILAFSGGAEPNSQVVCLGEVLDDVLTHSAPQAQANQVVIEVEPRVRQVELYCDAGQLERAVLNLVFNALDAVEAGGRVWIHQGEASEENGVFPLVVEDDGPGIDPAVAPRLFHPFFTTKDNGTGLGLAIVHRIAEANGGSIEARNSAGGGAAMVLRIPKARGNKLEQNSLSCSGFSPGGCPPAYVNPRGRKPAARHAEAGNALDQLQGGRS
ncbi:MAG: sensor histidine kinase [Planctomycetes bacterium]|nr:sensor histidine kinase [Planctomycetota bacterium]